MACTRSRVGLLALLIVLGGLMLAVVPRPQAAPLPDKARQETSAPRVYALLDVGTGRKGFTNDLFPEDTHRQMERRSFKSSTLRQEDSTQGWNSNSSAVQ